MKICITTLEFPPDTGGVGESVKRISTMLSDLGHEVHIVVFHAHNISSNTTGVNQKGFDTNQQEGVFVHRYQHVARGSQRSPQDFLSDVYIEIQKLHNREKFDLFHAFYLNETGFLTTLLAKEVGRPIINSIRGADIHKNIFNPKSYSQTLWAMENSNWMTFVSRELERRAHVLVPSTRGRTSAFWNSIVPFDFEALEKPRVNGQLKGTVIGASGNFRNKKGVDFLIQACAELATEIELTLLLVGDFISKERAYWNEFIINSGIMDRVVITGSLSREEAIAYLHVVDIFAIPSLRDGCPNAMMEAMLAQKAIVGSSVDAIGEILSDGEDGLIVRPGSTEDLVCAIKKLAENPGLRERLGAAAREKALLDLAPECEQNNWLNVYDRVMTARKPVHFGAKRESGERLITARAGSYDRP
jgi:glycosyltransferase involved in cell wall biosynthesis